MVTWVRCAGGVAIARRVRTQVRTSNGSAARLADRAPGTASRESNRERARGRLRTCHSRVPHRALGASDAIAPSLAPVRGNTPRRRRRSAGEAVLSPLLCEWTRDGIVCGRARTSGDRLGRADVRRRGAALRRKGEPAEAGSPFRSTALFVVRAGPAVVVAVRSVRIGAVRPDHVGQICTVQVGARQVGSG